MSNQPEALRLAELMDAEQVRTVHIDVMHCEAAAELRRLHEVNAMLVESLWAMLSEGADHGIYEDNPAYIQAIEALAKAQGENE